MSLPKLTPEMIDDVDVLELISEVESGNIVKVPTLFRKLFGDEGYDAIKASLAKDGKTKASDLIAWFGEQAAAKN